MSLTGEEREDLYVTQGVHKVILASATEQIEGMGREDLYLRPEVFKVILTNDQEANKVSTVGTKTLDGSETSKWVLRNGTAAEADEVNILHTTRGIKLISDGVNTTVRNNNVRPFRIHDQKYLTIFLYVSGRVHFNTFYLYLATDINYTNYVSYELLSDTLVDGWNEIRIDLSKTSEAEGTMSEAVKSVQLVLSPKPDRYVEITFDSLFVGQIERKAQAVFTFDDGWRNSYDTVFPLMLEYGFRGSIGIVSNWIDNDPDYMTSEQVREMYDFGWDMFNHTANHKNLANITPAEVVAEVTTCTEWLETRGYKRASRLLAYPYGAHSEETVEALRPHLVYARTLVEGYEPQYPIDALKGKTKNVVTYPIEQLKGYVDEAIRLNSSIIFCLHKVDDTPDEWDTTLNTQTFKELLAYLYSLSDSISVKTLSEWVNTNS